MFKNKTQLALQIVLILAALIFFCYFRLIPIFNQTVPYTYDQGRDFLKAQEIVAYKNLTFIGPTTGIMGMFHGAWWYYLLSFFYFIFNGLPNGFYLGMFLVSLVSVFLFFIFIKKELSFWTGILFLFIVSVSEYFIKISFFPANNFVVPTVLLLFIFSVYKFFQTQKDKYLALLAISLGFIFEFEVAFGLFAIPTFFLLILFFREFRLKLKNIKSFSLFIISLSVVFLPRLLFEIKHLFSQTKILLGFFTKHTAENPQSFYGVFIDRIHLFNRYVTDIFYMKNGLLTIFFIISSICILIYARKKIKVYEKNTIIFLSGFILLLFTISLLYRNNFFWDYYFEGIHYVFLFLMLLSLTLLTRIKSGSLFLYTITGMYLVFNLLTMSNEILHKRPLPDIGLRADVNTINTLYNEVRKNNFCNRIYTPPVIPYTYNYLINYYSDHKSEPKPTDNFINNQCWYIIDYDENVERVTDWRKHNIPQESKLVKKIKMENGTLLELWEN